MLMAAGTSWLAQQLSKHQCHPQVISAHDMYTYAHMPAWLARQRPDCAPVHVVSAVYVILQYCRMAADPSSALLLQPTCRAVADLHSIMVAAILGPQFLFPHNRPAACSTMLISARVLGWYAQAVYGVFMPVAAFCTLEWRLKQRWMKEALGGQLVYGPLCWRQSQPKCSKLVTAVQDLFSWLLVTAVCWVLLWEVVTWIVPQLPLMQCQSCEDTGTCLPVTCGE